ncbi:MULTISPECIES: phenazine biosynthesis protein PhzE [Pseudomonas]|nr:MULTISPECIES: phenazine biosynthesis protein PhzE [Pseudomonas]EKA32641.1 phenazine biosynthesis protein PhzE [Pseudomonas aeruginosa ATCC 14886]KAA2293071.1 phenazine-specific anthranilate synthase component I [Pseudomonas aeruginosa]KSS24740.1 phenazine-specific anthranilate synthase component I [Pseudomonas aeruginosa]MBH8907910.1 phenazine-specific anthranilate synthase component I [Pseudomonas aeruginosa]MBI7120280.1 phenazine-specific anthranilate synthase component I [Pseudomonas aer
MNALPTSLLQRLLERPAPFALLYRPESNGPGLLDVIRGETLELHGLADLPLDEPGPGLPRHDLLALIPYRQIAERGFEALDDGTPLLALKVLEQELLPLEQALALLPNQALELSEEGFDLDDEAYAEVVGRVIADEIGRGEGANFVIKRRFQARIDGYATASALSFFRQLLLREKGAYWTFIVHTGERTLVGASPERHISVRDGLAVMNPISGTYRYPPAGPNLAEVMEFLDNRKEADELYMVVDEELKMMARICEDGGRVLGPYLKEMAHLAHTEYFIEGQTNRDVREVLRETLFAPTVTGSPLESACRVIRRYEPQGRGYYSGVAALIGGDGQGGRTLDSAILIRTAEIESDGRLRIGVGSTIVRHSDPLGEAAESRAKASGLIAALKSQAPQRLGSHPHVVAALASRNAPIADFWLRGASERQQLQADLSGREVLIVDAEDTFTSMIAKQLKSLGLTVTVRGFQEPYSFDGYDLVIMGPGPGNPTEIGQPKIGHLHLAIRSLLSERRPFLAVCLSHQVLSLCLGLDLQRRQEPNQGVQKQIDLFGAAERVGFYNTFAARALQDRIEIPEVGPIEISRDRETGEVHALRGPRFASMQFHPESVLTREGPRIIADLLRHALVERRP